MQALVQVSTNFSTLNTLHSDSNKKHSLFKLNPSKPINYYTLSRAKVEYKHIDRLTAAAFREKWSFLACGRGKDGILRRGKRIIAVRFSKGLNGGSGGGGGGGGVRMNSETARVLGNLALAIILTYFTMTGQLGWLLDAVVSIWIIVVLIPIVGLGAFLWWAGRDIVQSSCPNCGNEFQMFKSTLNDDLQLCPYCSQPFSVVGNEFVREPVQFSNESRRFGEAFGDFSPQKKTDQNYTKVVDVEAEIRDAD